LRLGNAGISRKRKSETPISIRARIRVSSFWLLVPGFLKLGT